MGIRKGISVILGDLLMYTNVWGLGHNRTMEIFFCLWQCKHQYISEVLNLAARVICFGV